MSDTPRIVLIDDDAGQLDVLSLMVRQQRPDWKLQSACIAFAERQRTLDAIRSTISQATEHGPLDLLMIDEHLGEHLASGLLHDIDTSAPVIILTGASLADTTPPGGAKALVCKPFSLADAQHLFATCDQILARKQS